MTLGHYSVPHLGLTPEETSLAETLGTARIACVIGTRPEAIKMAPVIRHLQSRAGFDCRVIVSAQHRDLLDQVLALFNIKPAIDLDLMEPNQTLNALAARLFRGLDEAYQKLQPDAVLVQGDTTTAFVAGMAAFHRKIAVGHVEAGLRTGDLTSPFPEEANRTLVAQIARWHFAPTESARLNLLREGVPDDAITVTGNTVIDALLDVAPRARGLDASFAVGRRLILLTAHRRENFGDPLKSALIALRRLVDQFPDVAVLFPVHPNPNVKAIAHALLGDHPRIKLVAPLGYEAFVAAMKASYIVITDSGGVQEEAPALAKPVLVLRAETERPEAVDAGVVRLVGTDSESIVGACARLLSDPSAYSAMARGISPYGDGYAAGRIGDVLAAELLGLAAADRFSGASDDECDDVVCPGPESND